MKDILLNFEKLKKFKDFIPIILFISTFIGGIWQLIELISIDLSYVRFFSPTQLLSDGIVIIIYLSGVWVFGLIFSYIFSKAISYIHTMYDKYEEQRHLKILKTFFLISYIVYFITIGLYLLILFGQVMPNLWPTYFPKNTENPYIVFITEGAMFLALYSLYKLLLGEVDVISNDSKNSESRRLFNKFYNRKYKSISRFLNVYLILLIFNLFLIIKSISELTLPINLKNLNKIENIIGTKNYNILYFNDNYIFIKINENEIEIIKTDKIID